MSDEVVFDLTLINGNIVQKRVPASEPNLSGIVAVSDNIAQLTELTRLTVRPLDLFCEFALTATQLDWNALTEIPAGVLRMTPLMRLDLCANRLAEIPAELGQLTAMVYLAMSRNRIAALPREIGRLRALKHLSLSSNRLTSLPSEIGQLQALQLLNLNVNSLTWLPLALDQLPAKTAIFVNLNPLPLEVSMHDSRPRVAEIIAATTALAMIREEATAMAIGLQELSLPALVTLEIIDAALPNAIPMHKKWKLITAVKHFQT